jgi:hypothetical protein
MEMKENKKYRAILIDPQKRTLTEIRIGRDIEEIYTALQCHTFTSGAHLSGSLEKGFDAIYVSDDELEDRDDPRFWFQVDADREPPSSHPIAGFGLAHGVDTEGYTCDLRISAADLAKRITYTQRKFKGFVSETLTSREGEPVGLKVEAVAPIIDGTEEN